MQVRKHDQKETNLSQLSKSTSLLQLKKAHRSQQGIPGHLLVSCLCFLHFILSALPSALPFLSLPAPFFPFILPFTNLNETSIH